MRCLRIQHLEKVSDIDEALLAVLGKRLRENDFETGHSAAVHECLHRSAVC